MPIRTRAEWPDRHRQPAPERGLIALPGLLALAAAFAAAELLLGLTVGGFFGWGRAEPLLFFLFRPWLLLVAAMVASRRPLKERAFLYAAALLLAALSESLFLGGVGAEEPWRDAARGVAAATSAAILFDFALQLGRRARGVLGQRIAAGALLLMMLIPGARSPYDSLSVGRDGAPPAEKRDLMMLSALPLIWGELGPLDPASRPAAAYKLIEEEFRVRPLDVLDRLGLAGGSLLLLAQPRALAPAELAAVDEWVRGGGRALILTDPMLVWPSELPLGDIRRAPAIGLLGPLLGHWGLSLERPGSTEPAVRHIETGGEERRLVLFAPGRFETSGPCTVSAGGAIADCRLGSGRAILLGDADMLHDRLWVGPGPAGAERHGRVSDNPLVVADLLDALAGDPRPRARGSVEWLDPWADRGRAILAALLPLLAAGAPAAASRFRRAR